jgi:DNA modification methylase
VIRILTGDCRDVLATLPDESVQCCVTSPPYFGLRDYGNAAQIGLEPTPDAYVAEMVAVFREVRRVLRADGTCWLNIGDSYASSTKGQNNNGEGGSTLTSGARPHVRAAYNDGRGRDARKTECGVPDKNLIGIPWLLAFALRADGWYLRQEIIWHKPNPMPESVTDRCTKAHESVFLLTKSARYYFDAKAIAEQGAEPRLFQSETRGSGSDALQRGGSARQATGATGFGTDGTRNKRSVWTIATQPYSGSHFATMPPELAETCIKAGTSEKGQCPHCGAPWARVVDVESRPNADNCNTQYGGHRGVSGGVGNDRRERTERGWSPSCTCPEHQPIPQMVLDPFGGAGTTALVADRLQRDATIIELNPAYAALARDRINGEAGMFSPVAAE